MRKLIVATLLLACTAPTASATSWRDAGRIGTNGVVTADGVDGTGLYTALFAPKIGEQEEEVGEVFDIHGPVQARERAPGGRFVTRPGLRTNNAVMAIGTDGERIAVSRVAENETTTLEVSTRRGSGTWSEPQVIARGQRGVGELDIDVAPTGEATVSWIDTIACCPYPDATVMAATRPAGARDFAAATEVDRGTFNATDVEMDAAGNAMAAWTDFTRGTMRVARKPAGAGWSEPESVTVPDRPAVAYNSSLVVAPNGRAALVWLAGPAGRDYPPSGHVAAMGTTTGPIGTPRVMTDSGYELAAATDGNLTAFVWTGMTNAANGRVRAVLVEGDADLAAARARVISGTAVTGGGPQVLVAKGRATFAWLRRVAGPRVVEARSATADGRFTGTQTLSSRSYTSTGVRMAASSRGEAWVTWRTQRRDDLRAGPAGSAKASSRTGSFERAQNISPEPNATSTGVELLAGPGGSMLARVGCGNAWCLRAYGGR